MHPSRPPTICVPDGNRNTVITNRNWPDIVDGDPQVLEIPGWKTLALTSLGGQDCTALENRRSGEQHDEKYISICRFRRTFWNENLYIQVRIIDAFAYKRCHNQLDLLRLSPCLSACNEQLENRPTEFMKFEMNGLLKSVTNRLQHWLKYNNDFTCISARNSRITRP